jgi:hypothetical protein
MAKYKVTFSGFCYVEADSEDEAKEKADDGEYAFSEYGFDSVEEVDEFVVRW